MSDFERLVRESIADLPHDLEGYATRAAMLELSDNWRAALGDGAKPKALVQDIDRVIHLLTGIKQHLNAPKPYGDDRSPS